MLTLERLSATLAFFFKQRTAANNGKASRL
jgi:hypothetical protein